MSRIIPVPTRPACFARAGGISFVRHAARLRALATRARGGRDMTFYRLRSGRR